MNKFRNTVFFAMIMMLPACSSVKTETWPNGNVKSEISFQGKDRNGLAKYWYEDGIIQMECNYRDNKLDGILTRYYPNGYKEELLTYKNDTLNGPTFQWTRIGDLVVEANYVKGKLHGHYRELYPENQTKTEGTYVNGDIDGHWLYFNESGKVVGQGNFVHGDGVQKTYYPETGRLKTFTNYKGNFKEGPETDYSPEGKEVMIKTYSMGKLTDIKNIP